MILLYRLIFIPALVFALPYYLWRMVRRGGYAHGFAHRFGAIGPLPPKRAGVQRLWIQAVSVGEVRAIAPLLEALGKDPRYEVVLTTTTSTGYAIVREKYAALCIAVGIFPLDFWLFSALAWRRIRPDRVLLMEGELWPEHLHQAKKRKVPANLINARLSDRSLQRYLKVRPLASSLLKHLESILAGSPLDAERFTQLGYPQAQVQTVGNLKFDVHLPPLGDATERQHQRAALGFAQNSLVLLGSSTWPGEEAQLIDVMATAKERGIDCRLLLVPRHAERRSEIRQLLKAHPQYKHQFRSELREVPTAAKQTGDRPLADETAPAPATPASPDAATAPAPDTAASTSPSPDAATAPAPDAAVSATPASPDATAAPASDAAAAPSSITSASPATQLDIYVADTTGELAWLTQLADLAFIGKSLPPHGEGQSPIEAAAAGLPIVHGPGMSNFRPVCRSLAQARAAIAATDADDAATQLLHLLADADARAELSEHCTQWLKSNQGATERTLQWLHSQQQERTR